MRLALLFVTALVSLQLWTPPAAATLASEHVRQFVTDAVVRIEVQSPSQRGICTGWVGWSEPSRSAVYTAAHCHQEGAHYRLTLATGETVYATGLARWDAQDLMALWISKGGLRALRSWKLLPEGTFRALHVLPAAGGGLQVLETQVDRVYREIRFQNHPGAIAIPLYSTPGTSGAPVVDSADGLLLGMVVGHLTDRPDIAAVVPAQLIYDTVLNAARSR